MAIFEPAQQPRQPNAQQGAIRIKRLLQGAFQQIEGTLNQVRRVCERHGRGEIADALGSDDEREVIALYKALKDLVEKHKPDAKIDSLPN